MTSRDNMYVGCYEIRKAGETHIMAGITVQPDRYRSRHVLILSARYVPPNLNENNVSVVSQTDEFGIPMLERHSQE